MVLKLQTRKNRAQIVHDYLMKKSVFTPADGCSLLSLSPSSPDQLQKHKTHYSIKRKI